MESRLAFLSPPSPCEYLPDQEWQLYYDVVRYATPAEYLERLERGWRRFGHVLFRPECPSCRSCWSLRVPVETFTPSRSQRRAWSTNQHDVAIRIGTPTASLAKIALFDRYHEFQHAAKDWPPTAAHGLERFTDNPFPTQEWCYYVGDRLIGVGYVDVLPAGLSAIYFYYDPQERHRSLGTYNVLAIIQAASERKVPYVYLGYYVEGCRSLEYKARFRPNEVLKDGRAWEPLTIPLQT
jgi:arginyl-tRNA--protein-N-Asp/Glu arginylyltransferase